MTTSGILLRKISYSPVSATITVGAWPPSVVATQGNRGVTLEARFKTIRVYIHIYINKYQYKTFSSKKYALTVITLNWQRYTPANHLKSKCRTNARDSRASRPMWLLPSFEVVQLSCQAVMALYIRAQMQEETANLCLHGSRSLGLRRGNSPV